MPSPSPSSTAPSLLPFPRAALLLPAVPPSARERARIITAASLIRTGRFPVALVFSSRVRSPVDLFLPPTRSPSFGSFCLFFPHLLANRLVRLFVHRVSRCGFADRDCDRERRCVGVLPQARKGWSWKKSVTSPPRSLASPRRARAHAACVDPFGERRLPEGSACSRHACLRREGLRAAGGAIRRAQPRRCARARSLAPARSKRAGGPPRLTTNHC